MQNQTIKVNIYAATENQLKCQIILLQSIKFGVKIKSKYKIKRALLKNIKEMDLIFNTQN
jgi:hypothetical protein